MKIIVTDEIKKYTKDDSSYRFYRLEKNKTMGRGFRIKDERVNVEASTDKKVHTKYTGEWKDGLKHGQGKWTYKDGPIQETYVGEWKDGMKHGQGKFTYTNGSLKETYVGEWKDNERHGLGKMIHINGSLRETYVGEWEKNKRFGSGKMNCCKDS